VVLILPLCFLMKIPYAVPIAMGLIGTPASAVTVACGVVAYYMIHGITQNVALIAAMTDEETSAKFKFIIDTLIGNKEMIVMIAAFGITVVLVYFIRRLSTDHAWTIAIAAGAVVDTMILFVGALMFDIDLSLVGVGVGTVVSILLVIVLRFFVFNVDYSRTEKVQFEDDDYYYYVKAVPKVTVTRPEKKVKKISSQTTRTAQRTRSRME
jgi:hypothetical protein